MEDSPDGGGGSSSSPDDLEDDSFYSSWDCDGCPPPYFDLPPPPRPDFLEDSDYCEKKSSPYDSCELQPVVVIDSQAHLENDLLNLLLVVISALVLVIVILVVAVVIWR